MALTSRSVAVTGLGVVSALGADVALHYRRLCSGESGIVARLLKDGIPVNTWAPVDSRAYRRRIENRMLRKLLQPSAAMAVVAAGQAIEDAGLLRDSGRLARAGIFVGSVSFELTPDLFLPALELSINKAGDFDFESFANRGMSQLDPLLIVKGLPNGGLCGIAIEFGVLGPNLNIANDSIGGTQAIAAAVAAIASGDTEIAIAGGYDSLLQAEHMVSDYLEGRFGESGLNGYTVGEGAAMCVLESAEHALGRGARIYAEIASVEENCGEFTNGCMPLVAVARRALESAGLESELQAPQILFGDLLGIDTDDKRELVALPVALGTSAAITGHVGALGFTGAASGAFSFVHAALSISTSIIPPAVNCFGYSSPPGVRIITHSELTQSDTRLVWHSDGGLKNVAIVLRRSPYSDGGRTE